MPWYREFVSTLSVTVTRPLTFALLVLSLKLMLESSVPPPVPELLIVPLSKVKPATSVPLTPLPAVPWIDILVNDGFIVSASEIPEHPRVVLKTYSVSTSGFTQVANLKNPAENGGQVYSMHGGFLQRSHDSLLLWLAAPAQGLGPG